MEIQDRNFYISGEYCIFMDAELFKELGFTEREQKVYIALLELGLTTVGPIASRTKLQHSKVYETLDKLQEKGLVSYIIQSKTRHYQPAEPKEILNIIEDRKQRFLEIIEELELKKRYSQSKQVAIVYEGFKSFKALFNTIEAGLKKKDSYWAFAFKNEYYTPSASLFLKKFHERIATKKIDDKVIGHTSVRNAIKQTFQGNKNIKIRYTKNSTPLGVIIIKNKVINLVWGERPTAIEITSEQIFEQYKQYFLEEWGKGRR